jgi:hypothetical protein
LPGERRKAVPFPEIWFYIRRLTSIRDSCNVPEPPDFVNVLADPQRDRNHILNSSKAVHVLLLENIELLPPIDNLFHRRGAIPMESPNFSSDVEDASLNTVGGGASYD